MKPLKRTGQFLVESTVFATMAVLFAGYSVTVYPAEKLGHRFSSKVNRSQLNTASN
ncbi:hypothetical protein [Pseudalkalibacillus caeni]|uniref:hypothetical protein n=1 Tax=Exobacillus caeni TaxID=2574798 RepID=UPI0014855AB4|nr:hypothetical protein [Pseudalkalibacillus caeni]